MPYTLQPGDLLPFPLYIEVSGPSQNLRDISISVSKDQIFTDEVFATAVWVELVNKYFADSPDPLPSSLDFPLMSCVELAIANDQSTGGNRYGHGNFANDATVDTRLGGRILFEWQLLPSQAISLVTIDGTRQRETRHWQSEDPLLNWGCQIIENTDPDIRKDFPFNQGQDNELPNDDKQDQNTCIEEPSETGRFFTWDASSTARDRENPPPGFTSYNYPIIMDRSNFNEFVRIAISPNYSFDGENILLGSRASIKQAWSNAYNGHKDDDFLLSADNTPNTMTTIRTLNWQNDDSNSFPLEYQTISFDMTSSYGTFFLVTTSTEAILTRFGGSGCIEELGSTITPIIGSTYTLDITDLSVQITEISQFDRETADFLWHTYVSNNKQNQITDAHISLDQ